MNSFEKLKELFRDFPGIGPRQAERFAYFLLAKNPAYIEELKSLLGELKKDVAQCKECMRYFAKKSGGTLCPICIDESRDEALLILVAKDSDLLTIEKSGAFKGKYFILGGLVPILEKEPTKKIRLASLLSLIQKRKSVKEIILALSATHEGENTEEILKKSITEIAPQIKISHLGRGLSTGLEIEYSDSDTIKAALENKR
ncbi:MAG TPA: toprim domain-containing protein [Candidatus Paceibacterota bacterium]